MTEALRGLLLSMAGTAILLGIASLLPASRSMQRVMRLLGGVVMTVLLLRPMADFDFTIYAGALRRWQDDTLREGAEVQETAGHLQRFVIEDECSAYILEQAAQKKIPLRAAEVTAAWSTDGVWYPERVTLFSAAGKADRQTLTDVIESELGIPQERQEWKKDVQEDG